LQTGATAQMRVPLPFQGWGDIDDARRVPLPLWGWGTATQARVSWVPCPSRAGGPST